MKKFRAVLLLVSMISGPGLFSGCATSGMGGDRGNVNLLGIVRVDRNVHTPPSKTTLLIRSDELGSQQDYSGNKTELLWGLITITDY